MVCNIVYFLNFDSYFPGVFLLFVLFAIYSGFPPPIDHAQHPMSPPAGLTTDKAT